MTILAKFFSEKSLSKILKISSFRANRLLKIGTETLTVNELKRLGPVFPYKTPLPSANPRKNSVPKNKYKNEGSLTLPANLRYFKVTVVDVVHFKVRVTYQGRSRQFLTMHTPRYLDQILADIFNFAYYHVEKRKSPLYNMASSDDVVLNTERRNDSIDYLERLHFVFGEDFDSFRNLALKAKATIRELYDTYPLKFLTILDDELPEEETYTYIPYERGPVRFSSYIEAVDTFFKVTTMPGGIKVYKTDAGSTIAIEVAVPPTRYNKEQEPLRFLALYKGVEPIDRPFIIKTSKKGVMWFPVFIDSLKKVLPDTSTTSVIISNETPFVQMFHSQQHVQKELETPLYNVYSDKYVPNTKYVNRSGKVSFNRKQRDKKEI